MTVSRGFIAAAVALLLASVAHGQSEEFTYSGAHGPTHWAETPGWEACRGGSATAHQSPIAIDKVTIDTTLPALHIVAKDTPLNLVNNGHTIEEEYEAGTTIDVGGARYELAQFHFHYPSEHEIHGHHDALELHAVFAEPGSQRKVVIGQLFTIGAANPFLGHVLASHLPARSGEHVGSTNHINIGDTFKASGTTTPTKARSPRRPAPRP